MIFNSLEFVLFFVFIFILLAIYIDKASISKRNAFLLVISYIFYMAWYWVYAGLILFSTVVDYFVGQKLYKSEKNRRLYLIISLVTNLGLLGVFKYYNFFIDSTTAGLKTLGFEPILLHSELLLPVGISFYTFQTLSYTIDIYRRKIAPEKSFLNFATYVVFFPQLVAGPIVRASSFLPQLNKKIKITKEASEQAFFLIFVGLFKKIIIADTLALLAIDAVFNNPAHYSALDLLLALYGYALQIYCDFSGYSDIAIGVALLLGFQLPFNFNRPYLATSPSDFWKRWHISLSSWLRDYLYISLGGNKHGRAKTYRNLMLTMVIGGLWHGAAWNFMFWGAFHGLILIIYRILKIPDDTRGFYRLIRTFFFFHLIVFSWLLFRISDMGALYLYIRGLLEFTVDSQISGLYLIILIFGLLYHFWPKSNDMVFQAFNRLPVLVKSGGYAGLLLFFWGATVGGNVFIYFQF